MSEEEYMECSVVAYPRQIKFLHINGCAISYYVDRHVSDYVDRLQQENQKLKIQISAKEEVANKYKEVIDKTREYIQKMFETGFYNDDYYLGHLNQILQDKEVE